MSRLRVRSTEFYPASTNSCGSGPGPSALWSSISAAASEELESIPSPVTQQNCRGTAVPRIQTQSISTGSRLCGPAGGSQPHGLPGPFNQLWQSPTDPRRWLAFPVEMSGPCGELAFAFSLSHDLFSSPIPIVPGGSSAEEWQTR